jgi:hypothetical protein
MSGSEGEPIRGHLRTLADRLRQRRARVLVVAVGALVLAVSGIFGGLAQMKGPRLYTVAAGRRPPRQALGRRADARDGAGPGAVAAAKRARSLDRGRCAGRDHRRRKPAATSPTSCRWSVWTGSSTSDRRTSICCATRPARICCTPASAKDLIFLWEQAETAAVPKTIEVHILGKKQRIDTFSGRLDWMDKAPRARAFLPLEDQRKPS